MSKGSGAAAINAAGVTLRMALAEMVLRLCRALDIPFSHRLTAFGHLTRKISRNAQKF